MSLFKVDVAANHTIESCSCTAEVKLVLLLLHTFLSVFDHVELDTISLRQGNERLVLLSDHHHVLQSSREHVTSSVLQVCNLEGTGVLLTMGQDTNTTDVVSAGDHAHVSCDELH